MSKTFSVAVEIGGRIAASLPAAIKGAESAVGAMGRRMSALNAGVGSAFNTASRGVTAAGKTIQDAGRSATSNLSMPLGILSMSAGRIVFDFEKAGNALQAVTEMTRAQREEIEKLARAQNYFTPQDAMKSALELGKTGFNAEQIKGTLEGAMKLALAGDIAAERATDIVTNVLTSMRLPMANATQAASSMKRVGDVFAYTANKTNTDVEKLGETFKFAGQMAATAGLDVETLAAAAGTMANAGIRGSEAGVALRSALVRMVRPTKPALAAMTRLGLSFNDFVTQSRTVNADGILNSLKLQGVDASKAHGAINKILSDPKAKYDVGDTVAKITDAIQRAAGTAGGAMDRDKLAEGITDAMIGAADKVDFVGFLRALKAKGASLGDLTAIFQTQHGGRMGTLLQGVLVDAIDDIRKNAPGYNDRAVELRLQGVVGAVYRLNSAYSNLWITLAETGVLDTVSEALEGVSDGLKRLQKSNPALLKFGTYAALGAVALGPLMMVAGGAVRAIGLLGGSLLFLARAATVGLAANLLGAAKGIAAVGVAASAGVVARVRALAAGLIALGAVGGSRAVLAAAGASLLGLGRSVLAFPVVALRAIGGAMLALVANPVGIAITAIVAGLTALGVWVYNNWDGIKTFFSAFGESFMKGLGPEASGAVKKVTEGLQSVWDWFSKILGPLDESGEKWKSWGESAGTATAELVKGIAALPGKAIAAAGEFGSAMMGLAQNGWDAAKSVDWAGLGSAIIDGIVSGVTGAAGRLVDAVKGAASRAWNSAKGVFGGATPTPATPNATPRGGSPLEARALGGPVRGGVPYLVGERGPEIFVPRATGRIETNGTLRKLSAIGGAEGSNRRLASIGAEDGTPPVRVPTADAMVHLGATSQPVSKNVRGGNVSVVNNWTISGDADSPAMRQRMAREVERAIERVLARHESEQRGLLSD
ncbi:hypothetical protein GCM10007886_29540 [Methylobacterium gregans]|uniref:Phage tail tape measure protein domain-containing protein n=1 Tax=Methylobacterium gregans TaxID=374424 RepID=A0AA37HR33_9HYPH|nr:phage tail tape measure protein [Methylobacterium gregans]MDQ0523787.1 hypothetical protein [Methylobacterium gregans]GJD79387.1 hypothetical protein NBEOAGPD_2613 [Methylobacterium gregans]GLS54770.1 hypothetical protein GCM10007886_29540 [Methylobacterium gregans]